MVDTKFDKSQETGSLSDTNFHRSNNSQHLRRLEGLFQEYNQSKELFTKLANNLNLEEGDSKLSSQNTQRLLDMVHSDDKDALLANAFEQVKMANKMETTSFNADYLSTFELAKAIKAVEFF